MKLRVAPTLVGFALLATLASAGCSNGNDNGGNDAGSNDGGTRDLGSRDGSVWTRSSCKRGIAYGYHSQADLAAIQESVSWWYNWADRPDEDLRAGAYRAAGVEYVPMVWGGTFDADTVIANIPADTEWLLGFNEPNFGSQADISASAAAALWPEVERVADTLGLSIASPAVNFCGGGVCQRSCRLKVQAAVATEGETEMAVRSGLRCTTWGRSQGRVRPVQRSGCFERACS